MQAVAPEVIEENNRTVEQQLASLRFYDQRLQSPTNAAVLLFGMDVRRFLPGAYVQFLRISGTSLDAPIAAERTVCADLLTMLRDLDALIPAQIDQYPVDDTALRERAVSSYPIVAVRELLLNAVMHRNYQSTAPIRLSWFDDRIEIQSPGGLYGEASPANFPMQTSYRNPVVAEALKNLGYVNRFGRGVLRAQTALADNGSAPAEFGFDSGFVLATLRRHL
jgi:ATP-dependent DNA helicase RecG